MKKLAGVFGFCLTIAVALPAAAQTSHADLSRSWGRNYAAIQGFPNLRPPQTPRNTIERLRYWNQIAINASGLDHTPVAVGETRTFGEQLGPARASRAMAIVHIAMFEAINAIGGKYESYCGIGSVGPSTSMDAAIAQAAHDTLMVMYPSQASAFEQLFVAELERIPKGKHKDSGLALGAHVAQSILEIRGLDGSGHAEPLVGSQYLTKSGPGFWRQDPISLIPLALGAHWYEVEPFVMGSAEQFRIPPPPPLNSPEYTAAYNEVKSLGGDGIGTATDRTDEQRFIGIYWAYDGTPSLCAPPRMYNQIASQIAQQKGTNLIETARLLALVNVAMADAGIASWESKYFYEFWRPVTGIRESDPGTGPGGSGDGNPDTVGDPTFSPLGAPASGLTGPNFTPPFPSYPSGHAAFGGALFETLRRFYGTDKVRFTFVSDEYNGVTVDNQGMVREYHPRTFSTFSQAEEENGQSRIYLGIHWSFDKTEGIAQGRNVAELVFDNLFVPKH